jgi:UPF0716 protein FxsA
MWIRLLAAFIFIPLIELFLLLQLAQYTSVVVTILVVVGTGILGSILARRQGVVAWTRFRTALAEGRMPSREIQDGLMIVFAAALLLTPGLLTDTLGLVLLIPASRELIRRTVLCRVLARFSSHVTTHFVTLEDGPLDRAPPRSGRSQANVWTINAEAVQRKD